MKKPYRKRYVKRQKNKDGYRSKFESKVAASLTRRGVSFQYEPTAYNFIVKVPQVYCACCGSKSVLKKRSYTPDFHLFNDVIIETKGRFTADDRKIAEAMHEQHPELDLRMVFMNDNKLSKTSNTRYSDWCMKRGILFAIGDIPDDWIHGKSRK